jgi:hypothetical protein
VIITLRFKFILASVLPFRALYPLINQHFLIYSAYESVWVSFRSRKGADSMSEELRERVRARYAEAARSVKEEGDGC